jgi:hypothetical protein
MEYLMIEDKSIEAFLNVYHDKVVGAPMLGFKANNQLFRRVYLLFLALNLIHHLSHKVSLKFIFEINYRRLSSLRLSHWWLLEYCTYPLLNHSRDLFLLHFLVLFSKFVG